MSSQAQSVLVLFSLIQRSVHSSEYFSQQECSCSRALYTRSDKTKSMSIPIELLNEPYSYEDSGYRVEILVKRPAFHFEIGDRNVSVSVGGVPVDIPWWMTADVPNLNDEEPLSKSTSNVSLLTIYDTYGLEMVQLFVSQVLLTCRPSWSYVYLRGCCAALDIPYVESTGPWLGYEHRVPYLYTLCAAELTRRELASLRLSYSISPIEVVPELVALITGSRRISKEVASYVTH